MCVAVAAASVNSTAALNVHVLLLQEGTVEDTMDMDEVIRVLTAMLGSDRASAPRDMSIATWMDMTIGRGDDARLVYLPDLLKPQLVRVIGTQHTPSPSDEWQTTQQGAVAWSLLPFACDSISWGLLGGVY